MTAKVFSTQHELNYGTTTERNALTGMGAGEPFWDTDLKKLYLYDLPTTSWKPAVPDVEASGAASLLVHGGTAGGASEGTPYELALTSSSKIGIPEIATNVGSCWNNTTRTFTAPSKGMYMARFASAGISGEPIIEVPGDQRAAKWAAVLRVNSANDWATLGGTVLVWDQTAIVGPMLGTAVMQLVGGKTQFYAGFSSAGQPEHNLLLGMFRPLQFYAEAGHTFTLEALGYASGEVGTALLVWIYKVG